MTYEIVSGGLIDPQPSQSQGYEIISGGLLTNNVAYMNIMHSDIPRINKNTKAIIIIHTPSFSQPSILASQAACVRLRG